jgi:hypothetical protein
MARFGMLAALLLLGVMACSAHARSLKEAAPADFLRSNGGGNAFLVVCVPAARGAGCVTGQCSAGMARAPADCARRPRAQQPCEAHAHAQRGAQKRKRIAVVVTPAGCRVCLWRAATLCASTSPPPASTRATSATPSPATSRQEAEAPTLKTKFASFVIFFSHAGVLHMPHRPQIDTSQVVINKMYGVDSGTAVVFYALFKDQASAQTLINAFSSARAATCIMCMHGAACTATR